MALERSVAARATVCACALFGCQAGIVVVELPKVDGANAIVVALHGPDGSVQLSAGAPVMRDDAATDEHTVSAIYYAETFDVLGLVPGPIGLASEGTPSRGLPRPVYTVRRKGVDDADWASLETLPDDLLGVRIPAFDIGACGAAGGCYEDPFAAEEEVKCKLGCISTAVDPPVAPAPPVPPEPPRFWPCPAAFAPVMLDGIQACDPPALRLEPCPAGEASFFGTAECEPVGSTCPADGWPADVPAGAIYVSPGAAGGDGTRALPFDSLAEALAEVPPGGTIALGVGTLAEVVTFTKDVRILGACPFESVMVGDVSVESDVTLENLTLRGATNAVTVEARGTVRLSGVVVEGGENGVNCAGGRVELNRVLVRDVTAYGIHVDSGTLSATSTRLERCGATCLAMAETDAAIDGVVIAQGGDLGALQMSRSMLSAERLGLYDSEVVALAVESSSVSVFALDVRGVAAVGTGTVAMAMNLAGATWLRVAGGHIAGTGIAASTDSGAIVAGAGTALELDRVRIEDVTNYGIVAHGDGCLVTAEDLLVRGVTGRTTGAGAVIQLGATGTVERADLRELSFDRGPGFGLLALYEGSNLTVRDTTIQGVQGHAIAIIDAAMGTLERIDARAFTHAGIDVARAAVEASDVTADGSGVRETRALGCINATSSALTLTRASTTDCPTVGISAYVSYGTLADISIRGGGLPVLGGLQANLDPDEVPDGRGGLVLDRARVERTAGYGISVQHLDFAEIRDVAVVETGSYGLLVRMDEHLELRRAAITRAGGFGLALSRAEIDAEHVEISETRTVDTQGAGFELDSPRGSLSIFSIHDNDLQGVLVDTSLRDLDEFSMSDGLIVGNAVGIDYPPTMDVRRLLNGVRLDNDGPELRKTIQD